MNAWPFIAAAYALTLGASAAIALIAFVAMRRAEARAKEIGRP